MELTINVMLDASPKLLQLITGLTNAATPVTVLTTETKEAPAEQVSKQPVAPAGPEPTPAPAPAPVAEEKPKEISDADMREVVGPYVQANGADKIIALLKELGVSSNRTTDLPQDKRQEFIDRIKAMM